MSAWNHAICSACWKASNPDRTPVRVLTPEVERCCYCGNDTASGIWVRDDPKTTPCKGAGRVHGVSWTVKVEG